ncbi:MAG: serine protein kinase RIO [Nitrososphaerota archaeon]|nr:serine protein kinase RIO [Candidatus Calditenuaceae archaeon]MDW8073361.1 serine protein kinase RIO [Nitrososphaerota archaeon]
MSEDGERLFKKLSRVEAIADIKNRMLEKDRSLDSAAFEEVFDRATLQSLYELMRRGIFEDFYGVVSAGKESRIYYAKSKDGEERAVKIYLVNNTEFRKTRMIYVAGDHNFVRPGLNLRKFIDAWARREFRNLKAAFEAGVPVPKPIVVSANILVMAFLGIEGARYPLLRETKYTGEEYVETYQKVVENVAKLYRQAGLVHGDLSEFNIMAPDPQTVYFIDLSQAVPLTNPYAHILLMRDLRNVNRFFASMGVDIQDEESLFTELTGREPPSELTPI